MFAEESKTKEFPLDDEREGSGVSTPKEPIGIPALEALQQHFDSGSDKKL